MNKLRLLLVAAIATILLAACTTSKTTVSKRVDLSKYKYVTMLDNDANRLPKELREHKILLFDAIEGSRMELISENRIQELTPTERKQLLIAKCYVKQENSEAVITVDFTDYMTGRPIASCRGAYALGLTRGQDIRGAVKKVAKQISKTFD